MEILETYPMKRRLDPPRRRTFKVEKTCLRTVKQNSRICTWEEKRIEALKKIFIQENAECQFAKTAHVYHTFF
jgi:hypothetical protein